MTRTLRYAHWTLTLALATVAAAGCTMKETEVPALTGPSEFGVSLHITASPDLLPQDGVSTSQIAVEVRNENSQPLANRRVHLDIYVAADSHDPNSGFILKDEGTLTSKDLVTGSDGRATVTYIAPLGAPQGNDAGDEKIVEISAVPVGTNYLNRLPPRVRLRLVPLGVIVE